jgi:hypothetical protein
MGGLTLHLETARISEAITFLFETTDDVTGKFGKQVNSRFHEVESQMYLLINLSENNLGQTV